MMCRLYKQLAILCWLGVILEVHGSMECHRDADCGWNSYCQGNQCWCVQGYKKSQTGTNCLDVSCTIDGCVECLDDTSCARCQDYLESSSGKCITDCERDLAFIVQGKQRGKVCQGGSTPLSMMYVSIIVGAVAMLLLVMLMAVVIHCRQRTSREKALRVELIGQIRKEVHYTDIDKQIAGQDNFSYGSAEDEGRLKYIHYRHQVAALRPHLDTFIAMLRDAKVKCNKPGITGRQQLVYRHLIHQLCRVITLVNDSMAALPTDGNLLLDWAHRLLNDYLKLQQPRPSSRHSNAQIIVQSSFKPEQSLIISDHTQGHSHQHDPCGSGLDYLRADGVEADRDIGEMSGVQLIRDSGVQLVTDSGVHLVTDSTQTVDI